MMIYGPNTTNYIRKYPASLVIIEHVAKYAPEILDLFEIGLDQKYSYADPIIKANSMPYIIAHTTTNLREMPEVDIPNLEKGIGGECLSITLMTCIETAKKYGEEVLKKVERHNGHESKQFIPESGWTHNFLGINVKGEKIIFDPSIKKIERYKDGNYTIKRSFPVPSNIEFHKTPHYSSIGVGTIDYNKGACWYKGSTNHILGYIGNTPIILTLTVCTFNNTHTTPVITVYDEIGSSKGFYFYEQNNKSVCWLHQNLNKHSQLIEETAFKILDDLKQRNLLQIK